MAGKPEQPQERADVVSNMTASLLALQNVQPQTREDVLILVVAQAALLISARLGDLTAELREARAVSEQLFDTLHPPG